MPLYANVGDHRELVREDGPNRGICAHCGGTMIARRGALRTWHWAHETATPDCEAGKESEWHLAWKALALDDTQEIQVGNRRADVLAPGGYAVEFQKSSMTAEEVHGREDDWSTQGGVVWIFCAIDEAAGKRLTHGRPLDRFWEDLRVHQATWTHAPERVRSARAPSFLDLGNDRLLFVGGWRLNRNGPLTGYAWPVSKDLVVQLVLRGHKIPKVRGEDPEIVRARHAREREAERRRVAAERAAHLAAERAAERERAEALRRWQTGITLLWLENTERLEWLEGIRRYFAASVADQSFEPFPWHRWLRP
jgi:hypothetical protein